MNSRRVNDEQLQKMRSHPGFIAALDQSGGSTPKIHRHPTRSTSGPPTPRPMTGAPAPANDHHPIALTRSSRSNSLKISAIDALLDALPISAPIVRIRINEPALHATA